MPENVAERDGWLRVTRHFQPGDTIRLDLVWRRPGHSRAVQA
ncbi:hypothetical protein [Streptomyces sp. NBC_00829]|nr:hypothetical protein OG293_36830 [Streptomyces sp. NBC_00829]